MKKIRIGNASGFWGDSSEAMIQQVQHGKLDYLVLDYLAELAMSILQKQQNKNPDLGYVTDFINHFLPVASLIKEKKIKILTNGGGNNPLACGQALQSACEKLGVSLNIVVVEGDRIIDDVKNWYPEKANFSNFETNESFENVLPKLQSANVYIGTPALVKALEMGADIVIAGRATDSSLAIAPMVYEFSWKWNQWDLLASGMIAGHVIECGAQATGGNFTDWEKITDWGNYGYPLIEISENGEFLVTKPENTGGIVSIHTVQEQLLYEIGDPHNYMSPDVISDVTNVALTQVQENVVKVSGVKGKASPPTYKVSMAYDDGYKAVGEIIISGGDVIEKASVFSEIFWKRLNIDFDRKNVEMIGYNACHQSMVEYNTANEILLRFYAYDKDKSKLNRFSAMIATLILSGPQGVAVVGGRPRVQQVMAYWACLLSKKLLTITCQTIGKEDKQEVNCITGFDQNLPKEENKSLIKEQISIESNFTIVKLKTLCLARSGDKGNTSNIGVIARNEVIYDFLNEFLTANQVKKWFSDLCKGEVIRYDIPKLQSFNFMLLDSLDGGGTKALRIDAQGKTFAAALLNQSIKVPDEVLNTIILDTFLYSSS